MKDLELQITDMQIKVEKKPLYSKFHYIYLIFRGKNRILKGILVNMTIKSSLNGCKQCYLVEAIQLQSKKVCLPLILVDVSVGGS